VGDDTSVMVSASMKVAGRLGDCRLSGLMTVVPEEWVTVIVVNSPYDELPAPCARRLSDSAALSHCSIAIGAAALMRAKTALFPRSLC